MFTKSSKYGLNALCSIVSETSETKKLLTQEISEKTGVPKFYLSKILHQLTKKGFISSTKGRNGGFFITNDQLERPLLDVIIELEGIDRLDNCVIGMEHCNPDNPCPIHFLISKGKNHLHESFKNTILKDLQSENRSV